MESSSQRNNQVEGSFLKVWTFLLQGGDVFSMTLPGNPGLHHDGHKTVWKLMGTEALMEAAKNLIIATGCQVQVFTEEESPEQTEERLHLLQGCGS